MVVLKGVSAHVGANEKYKAHISKYVRHILKYLRHIFRGVFRGSVKCGQTRRVRASFDVRAGLLSVFFRVVFRCLPAGVCFFRVVCVIFLRAFMFLFSRGVRCARQVFCVSVV